VEQSAKGDEHRDVFGVGPICRVLPIAPSTFYARAAIARDPGLASRRAKQDKEDSREINRVFDDSGKRYGARKVWHTLRREGHDIARCTVERLMKALGIKGVVRGKKVVTTNSFAASLEPVAFACSPSQPCPEDRVNRAFVAQRPSQLGVSDFTYVSSWQGTVYVALAIGLEPMAPSMARSSTCSPGRSWAGACPIR
jgi:hypothetical protein